MFLLSGVLAAVLFAARISSFSAGPPSPEDIKADLAPLLSPGADVVLANDTQAWDVLKSRSSYPRIDPNYLAVVEVSTEQDIQQVVQYANSKQVPFLAVSTGSAWTSKLNGLNKGIQISMRKMQSASINQDGTTATIGGGTLQNMALKTLAKAGKRAVTGLCECVSVIGPLLGGGHSMQQGKYGFAADNLVSARMVLDNGTAVTVSGNEHPDLFWAIQGAGHNFGVVSSFEVDIHDVPPGDAGAWTLTTFSFDQSVLESFFETWNRLEDTYRNTTELLVLNGAFTHDANSTPIISLSISHEGLNPIAEAYISQFGSIGSLSFTQETGIPWSTIHDKMGLGSAPVCVSNLNFFTTPASFRRWNATNMREGFDMFAKFTEMPQFAKTFWLLESYGRGAAASFHDNAIAAEERENHLMTGLTLQWEGDDPDVRKKASEFSVRAKQAIQEGWSERHTYINYAVGYETAEEIYGRDKKHLQRLQKLKAMYDPENRFGFYAPLAGRSS